ncbi:MAG: hypothetical protein LC749_20705, partial [Actinobacteria bacterium]|nr:hypothetical protein [Actinomycetota bacterium]
MSEPLRRGSGLAGRCLPARDHAKRLNSPSMRRTSSSCLQRVDFGVDDHADMATRLIRLRYAASCAGCGLPLRRRRRHGGTATVEPPDARHAGVTPEAGGAPGGAPIAMVAGTEVRPSGRSRALAGGSAQRMADRKKAERHAIVRERHPHLGRPHPGGEHG